MSIVEEIRQNRESGAKRLDAEYKVGLMTLARRFCADESDAEELVNRTFAAVVERIDDYLEQSAFFGWMSQILVNIHSVDVRRKSNQTVGYPGELPDACDDAAESRVFEEVDASLLRDAVRRLPKDQRELLILHYFMEMPVAKIARFLSIPQGTVMSRLHYARKALAARLGVVAKKPGVKAVLLALALAALTAVGAVGVAAIRSAAEPAAEPQTTEPPVVAETAAESAAETAAETAADDLPVSDVGRSTQALTNEQNESANEHSEQKEQSMNANTRSSIISAALAATMAAAPVLAAQAADPGVIEVVAGNFGTGEFTLRVPASEKPLELYWAAAWADDTNEYSQWRDPVFLQDVPAGTTEVTVTVPGFNPDAASRFFLADPDNATVTRPVTLAGGKDGSGNYKSAFITGLHPNYDWRYELVFDVPEFKSNQAWILCHRNNYNNQNSLLLFIVRGSNDERLRFGYGTQHSIYSTPKAVLDVKYQAAINKNVCVVSNLTDNAFFCTLRANTSGQNYGEYNLWFGASSDANGKDYSTNDGCTFARVYSFKAWNGSGEMVGDFRPMVTNGVAGYFDLVTRKFFESGDQSLAASGTAVASGFEPYIASAETQHVDSLVAHLGALAAVSPALKTGPVECVSGSLPFAIGGIPLYGKRSVNLGDSVTFSVPIEKFIWWNESTRTSYRVASTGMRIDTYDANNDEFVIGTPQPGLRSYTFTRNSETDGVRVICLWDAEMLVDPPNGLRAECLRLVDVATNANGKTEVGHGPFNTGIHPVPATTRVFADVYLDSNNRTAQCNLSPVNERRFFGCRDESAHGQPPGKWQYNFQLTRENVTPPTLRVDMCNYMDGVVSSQKININNTARFEIDLNPTFTRLYDVLQGVTHLAEMKDTGYERSSEPLNGTLHIFGQHRLSDTTAPLCVDYNNTRYYTYAVWADGVNLSRDYAPCIDAAGKPAFYDRVGRNYIYPIGDKAEIVAEFTGTVGTNSVYVTGENEKGEPAAYLDPDATALGYHQIADGSSETFTATGRMVFDRRVVGYRVDTWTDGTGWVKGPMCKGRSVTLEGEKTFRRLVWIWDSVTGFVFYVK